LFTGRLQERLTVPETPYGVVVARPVGAPGFVYGLAVGVTVETVLVPIAFVAYTAKM
jgi:hypothetical protein